MIEISHPACNRTGETRETQSCPLLKEDEDNGGDKKDVLLYQICGKEIGENCNNIFEYVTHKKADGTIEELTQKQELEDAIIAENLNKYHQTEMACPLFWDRLFQDIGTYCVESHIYSLALHFIRDREI